MQRPDWHLYTGRPYVPAQHTDIRETFKRLRNQQQADELRKTLAPLPPVYRLAARR
jgi:hypothetical protein